MKTAFVPYDYAVLLHSHLTGRRYVVSSFTGPFDYHALFWWTEGNMGCDCNRAIFCGEDDDTDELLPCGETGYSLLAIVEATSDILPEYEHIDRRLEPSCSS